MKPLMKPIDTPDQVFHDGNPSTGELGTICSAEWLNDTQASIRDIQAECIAILRANGFEPDETKRDQLWQAIQTAIKSQVPAATLTTAGISLLSSSVTSDSEAIAATSKAVKIVMDNANARMAKDRNGSDIPNKALFRQNIELGNSATRNVGTTANTVAAGDDARIIATKKAIDDTQTGLAVQSIMWVSTADDLSNLPSGAHRFARNNTGVTVLPAAGYFFIEVLAKRDVANGSCILATSDTGNVWIGLRYTAPTDAAFTWIQLNQNVENLGLKETLNPTKRVSIGNIGTGAFDGNIPCLNIGDSDSGFIGSADGVIDIYANNQRVGRFNQEAFELLRTLVLRDAANAVGADTNFNTMLNTYDATGNLRWAWGPYKGGWDVHSYDQNGAWRNNPLHIDYQTSEVSVSCNFHVAGAVVNTNGNINGATWGGWLSDWLNTQFAARDNGINVRATIDWVNQGFVQNIDLTAPTEIGFRDGWGYPRGTDGAAIYNFSMVGGSSNVGNFIIRYTRKRVNGIWYVIN